MVYSRSTFQVAHFPNFSYLLERKRHVIILLVHSTSFVYFLLFLFGVIGKSPLLNADITWLLNCVTLCIEQRYLLTGQELFFKGSIEI
jgi:hypothetical protein